MSTEKPRERVLVCGAGVAGSVLAYWLARANFEVLVIERSREATDVGQGVEIEEPAMQVVKAMGIYDELKSKQTGEEGFSMVDENSHVFATFRAGGPAAVTGALEIMRGDLVNVLVNTANKSPRVTFEYLTTIQSLRQTDDKVFVDLSSRDTGGTRTEEFDFVVGADGVKSQTRKLILGSPEEIGCYKTLDTWVAYFSVPSESQDWPNSRLCNFSNARVVWIRPVAKGSKTSSVYLIHRSDSIPKLEEANASRDRTKQKEAFAEIYAGLGWETARIVREMLKSDNFYSDHLEQVKLKTWSKDRVVLLGDAAWAPTPLTGQGNQMAIIGAWVLAQEMRRDRTPRAFVNYENRLRKDIDECQAIPLGGYAVNLFNPKTSLGIWFIRRFIRAVCKIVDVLTWSGVLKWFPESKTTYFDLELDHETLPPYGSDVENGEISLPGGKP